MSIIRVIDNALTTILIALIIAQAILQRQDMMVSPEVIRIVDDVKVALEVYFLFRGIETKKSQPP